MTTVVKWSWPPTHDRRCRVVDLSPGVTEDPRCIGAEEHMTYEEVQIPAYYGSPGRRRPTGSFDTGKIEIYNQKMWLNPDYPGPGRPPQALKG
ncbi:hypothetical protein TNCV_4101731 [Trichonephila clavipes]|nr:hypothetical protein TNCV_4101731 [Trichonephila clavipes]